MTDIKSMFNALAALESARKKAPPAPQAKKPTPDAQVDALVKLERSRKQ